MAGTTNNRWEDSPGSIISCKASFAHTRSIVNDKSSNVFVTHLDWYLEGLVRSRTDILLWSLQRLLPLFKHFEKSGMRFLIWTCCDTTKVKAVVLSNDRSCRFPYLGTKTVLLILLQMRPWVTFLAQKIQSLTHGFKSCSFFATFVKVVKLV